MNQAISPRVFFAVIAVIVVIAGAVATWIWTRPTATEASKDGTTQSKSAIGPGGKENVKTEHGGPTPDQMKEIQEWKKANPGSNTKY